MVCDDEPLWIWGGKGGGTDKVRVGEREQSYRGRKEAQGGKERRQGGCESGNGGRREEQEREGESREERAEGKERGRTVQETKRVAAEPTGRPPARRETMENETGRWQERWRWKGGRDETVATAARAAARWWCHV